MSTHELARYALTAFMTFAGVMHFAKPKPFIAIVPRVLPAKRALIYVSGAFEILGGLGLLLPQTRLVAGWGLAALYVAVFPANVSMALRGMQFGRMHRALTWLRLPLQLPLIALAIWCAYGP